MTTYYVDSTGGSDANSGLTDALPLATIARFMTIVGSTGAHTLNLRRGRTFLESCFFPSAMTGTSDGARFIIQAYGTSTDPKPIWSASSLNARFPLRVADSSTPANYYTIQDIDFVGPATTITPDSMALSFNASQATVGTGNIIRRCVFRGTGSTSSTGFSGYGFAGSMSVNGEISDCEFYNISDDAIQTNGVTAYTPLNFYIKNNYIHNIAANGRNNGDGIQIGSFAPVGLWIINNRIDMRETKSKQAIIINHVNADNVGGGIVIARNTILRSQFGGATSDAAYVDSACIYVRAPDTYIRGNVLVGGEFSIILANSPANQNVTGNLILNAGKGVLVGSGSADISHNTIYGCATTPNGVLGIAIDKGGNASCTIRNNILVSNTFGINATVAGNNSFNLLYGNGSDYRNSANAGGGEVTTNPNLDGAYKVTSSSSAYRAGTHTGYKTDADGKQFNNPPTIGAYEVMEARGTRA